MERAILEALKHPALQGRWTAQVVGLSRTDLIVEQIGANPYFKTGVASRFYGGRMYEYPDVASVDTTPVSFYETHTFDASKLLQSWHRLKFDPTDGTFGLPVDYKKDIVIQMFPVNSSSRPAATLSLLGCWPMDAQSFDLVYTNAEGRLVCQCNFSVTEPRLVFAS